MAFLSSFRFTLPAEQLWKGVISVSNAGRKRGRGKRKSKKISKDLNRGQVIGVGNVNIVWPGLNAPVIRGRELVQQKELPKDEERELRLQKVRDAMGTGRSMRLHPLERGWSGNRLPGRSIGPPDSIGEDTFEGFDTKVLEFKTVTSMSGNFGRVRRLSIFAVAGNKNGLGGFACISANTSKSAINRVKKRAAQQLMYIERFNNHTIYHDFFTQFGRSKIFVEKKPEGYGLVCHRVIKTICEVLGIKDLYAKVEGSTSNVQNITKAFFLGLLRQKTHQMLADEKNLHVVEFRKDRLEFPTVVASPNDGKVRTLKEISPDEELDITRYAMDGGVPLKRKKYPLFYEKYYGYEIYLKKYAVKRNREKVRINLLAEYGEVRSFLTDKYPECRLMRPGDHIKGKEESDII